MTPSLLLLFATAALIGIATPGPTVLLALSNGARHGLKAAWAGIAGALLSDAVLIAAVAIGLGAMLAASEALFQGVKWIGVGYLAYLGLRLIRHRAPPAGVDVATHDEGLKRSLFLKCFLVAVTNPKGVLFFSAFLPQFIDPVLPQAPQYAVLAGIFIVMDCLVMGIYVVVGTRAARALHGRGMTWMHRGCGAALVGLAAALAFVRRPNV